ncbi:MAG: GNAT family protein [Bacilli bacterium]|nr:GNAT family N-acetyltransferase [Bacilli bacterium]
MNLDFIETPRLILREIELIDAYDMYEYARLDNVGPTAGWQPHSSLSETKATIKLFQSKKKYGQPGVYAIILKEENKMIGTVELHTYTKDFKAELGYTINPRYWGNGYALEASKYIIRWGFEVLGLKRIECTTFTSNQQSSRVCEKLGLTYEGRRKKGYLLYDGSLHDLECFAITDDEYFFRIYNNTWW